MRDKKMTVVKFGSIALAFGMLFQIAAVADNGGGGGPVGQDQGSGGCSAIACTANQICSDYAGVGCSCQGKNQAGVGTCK